MNHSRYHVSSWLKFCFLSLGVLIFGTTIFPNKTYAAALATEYLNSEDFDGSLRGFSTLPVEERKALYRTYRTEYGSNITHLINVEALNTLAEELDDPVTLSQLLLEANSDGYIAINRFTGGFSLNDMNKFFLNGLITPSGEWRMTPLMALALMDSRECFAQELATLQANGIDVSQRDSFGNTVKDMSPSTVADLVAKRFIDRNFDSSLWQAITDDQYVRYLHQATRDGSSLYPEDFANFVFKIVLMQARTDLHRAFLQQDVSTQELRDAANDLWAGFFNVYDSLLDDEEREKQKEWSLGWRALCVISSLDLKNMELQEASINIIAKSSSFPHGKKLNDSNDSEEEKLKIARGLSEVISKLIKSRLLNQKEGIPPKVGEIVRLSLVKTIVNEETNAITRMFIGKKPYYELDEKEKEELSMYQLWCTVKAFFRFAVDISQMLAYDKFFSTEACLDLLDRNLSNSMPAGMPESDRKAIFQDMLNYPEGLDSCK